MIKDRLEEIIEIQNSVKINHSNYSSTKKYYSFNNYSLPAVLLRDVFKIKLWISDAAGLAR